MTITETQLRAPVKIWSASVTLAGNGIELTESLPKRSLGFTQKRGICTVTTKTLPVAQSGDPVVVTVTLNGESTVFFTGNLDARPISDLPLSFELGFTDSLAHLTATLAHDLTWSSRSWVDAVGDLLVAAGFTLATDVAAIFDPGATYRIGTAKAIKILKGTAISAAFDTLMTFGGCTLMVMPNGKLTVADNPGWPTTPTGPVPVYAFGATTSEYGFFSARRTMTGRESAVAAFTAKGPALPNQQIPDATFTVSGMSGAAVVEQYEYIQSDATAKAIAEREIVRRNRASTEVDVTAPMNPNLRPGDTVSFRHPELGFPENTLALVIGTNTSDDTMTMTLSVGAQPAEGTITVMPPPSPNFTMRYEVQPIQLAGVIATNTIVECIDTSSDPSGFRITSRAWKAEVAGSLNSDGSFNTNVTQPEPNTASWSYDEKKTNVQNPIPHPIFVFPTLDGAKITLVVGCESSGEGNTTTKSVVLPQGEVFTRTISVAAGAMGWRILAGSTGWRSWIGAADCSAVPTINDQGPLLAGFADGSIYQTQDMLATPPLLLGTVSGAVHCFWVNEGNPMELLVGAGSGLYRSSDGGAAWSAVATFADTVEYCENSPTNASEIRVCTGNTLQIAYDGASFTTLLTGAEGTICRKVGSAPWGHLAVFSGAADISGGWAFEESGIAIDWTGVATENTPTDLTSVTPLQYEEGYLVADGGAADMIRDGLFSQLGYLASQGMTKIYKLMRADGGFAAQYCATAEAGGPHKIVMSGGKAFPIDTSDALRMGYGQATDPAIPPELLVLPQGQSGGADKLMHYIPVIGWQFIDLPMAGQVWRGVDICPNNGSEWLIWTDTTLYWTATAGRMWVQIFTPPEDEVVMRYHTIQGVGFTGKGSEWIFAMASSDGFNNQGSALVVGVRGQRLRARIAGTCDFPRWMRTTTAPYQYVGPMRRGYDGEIWALVSPIGHSANGVSYDRQAWIDTTGVTIHEISDTSYAPACLRDPAAGRAGIAVWGTNVGITPNYQTTVPVPTVSAGTSVVACSLGLIVGGRTGIGMIVNLDSDPTVQVIAAGGTVVGQMVAGSLRRGAGVLCDHTNLDGTRTIYAHNGVQWAATTTPDIATSVCPCIGVVER